MNVIFARIFWLVIAILIIVGGIALCSTAWGEGWKGGGMTVDWETLEDCKERYHRAMMKTGRQFTATGDLALKWCAENPLPKPKPCHWEVKCALFSVLRFDETAEIGGGWEPFSIVGDSAQFSIIWLRRKVCE